MKNVKMIFALLLVLVKCYGQGKIYFFNKTGRPVWIQNMTITGIGSFPHVLDTDETKTQYIPIDAKSPAILNVMIVPKSGPYGTADGIYYLFKKNDTVVVRMNEKNQPLISHFSSSTRTKELAFALQLLEYVGVTPFYTLIKSKPSLYKEAWTTDLNKRDKIIDSLSRPYINSVQSLCASENIDNQIGELYRNHYVGSVINDKLFLGYKLDSVHQHRINNFYKDSVMKWSAEMNCRNCENVPFYNSALQGIYHTRFTGLAESSYMDTLSVLVKGYAKDFLLSNYMVRQIESTVNTSNLLNRYDRLCEDTLYKQMVHNSYLLHQDATKMDATELATMMKGDKSETGFNQLINTLKGKVVYIDFWASWCKPCIEEIPFSHALREKLAGKKIAMLYISLDTDFGSWRRACDKYNLNGVNSFVLINPDKNDLSKKLSLGPIPRYIVIDKKGKITKLDASRPSDKETYAMLLKLVSEH